MNFYQIPLSPRLWADCFTVLSHFIFMQFYHINATVKTCFLMWKLRCTQAILAQDLKIKEWQSRNFYHSYLVAYSPLLTILVVFAIYVTHYAAISSHFNSKIVIII